MEHFICHKLYAMQISSSTYLHAFVAGRFVHDCVCYFSILNVIERLDFLCKQFYAI